MWSRRWILLCALVPCAWLVTEVASPLRGQQNADADKPVARPAADQEMELDIRYAQAYLKLMEATLAKHEEINRRNPNTIRPTVMQAIQEAVGKARVSLQLAQSDEVNDSKIYVSRSETDLRLVEESLRKAEAANRQRSGIISPGEIERLKAEREFARIKVEKARHLASESPLSNVRFELEQLREDVQDLRLLVAILRSGRN